MYIIYQICMIYKQCNYSILLLLYDFEFENVEIKQTWNLKLENLIFLLVQDLISDWFSASINMINLFCFTHEMLCVTSIWEDTYSNAVTLRIKVNKMHQ